MNQRVEVNRHHAVTILSLVLALAGIGIALLAVPAARWTAVLSLAAIAAILVVRTILVELGVRRRRSAAAIAREARVRSWLAKHLGIVLTAPTEGRSVGPTADDHKAQSPLADARSTE